MGFIHNSRGFHVQHLRSQSRRGSRPQPPHRVRLRARFAACPTARQLAFEAVNRIRSRSRADRSQVFRSALEGLPNAYEIFSEVISFTDQTEDRDAQNRILHAAHDALQDPPILDWDVHNLFAQPSLNVLVGDPGSKKSYLAIDLAVCIALGKPWLGRPVNQGPALIVDEELGLLQLWGRLHASLHAHDAPVHTPLHFLSLGGYDLRDRADADALAHRALSIDARLIVIDALADVMGGGTESNPASIQPVLFHLRRMAEHCRAAVIVLHHTNRHGVFSGSSAIAAAADLMLAVESAPTSALIELRALKARFLAPEPFCARANFTRTPEGKDRFFLSETHEKPARASVTTDNSATDPGSAVAILEFLSSRQASTREELTSELSRYSEGTIRNVLSQLLASGLINRTDGGKQGKKATYELSKRN